MNQKKHWPIFSEENLDDRHRQSFRVSFLKQLEAARPDVRTDLLTIWKEREPRIRAAISVSQDQLDTSFDAIREEALTKYNASYTGAISVSGPTQNLWGWYQSASQGADTLRSELEDAIREWARKYRIEADWLIYTAIENIQQWWADPAQEERDGWFSPSVGMLGTLPPEEAEFRFRLPHAWDPTYRKPAEVRKRIKKAFNEELKTWMKLTQNRVKKLGFNEVRERPELEKHIDWLIRYRVLRKGYTAIAREDGLAQPASSGRRTVTEGIETVTKLIGFDSDEPV